LWVTRCSSSESLETYKQDYQMGLLHLGQLQFSYYNVVFVVLNIFQMLCLDFEGLIRVQLLI
jgi:hypothetical protein